MADMRLAQILDDCINRLNRGETIADCLRAYPEYQRQLLPMLEAGRLARRATVAVSDIPEVQTRVGLRFEQALRQPMVIRRRSTGIQRWITFAAVFVLIIGLFGGSILAAQSAIPGDALYGFKQWSEATALILTGNNPTLQEQFAQRRIQETRQLVRLRRAAEITFAGTIESVRETELRVEGLTVRIPVDSHDLLPGMRVEIQARTNIEGDIIALNIREVRPIEPDFAVPATRVPLSPTSTSTPAIPTTPNAVIRTLSSLDSPSPTVSLPAPDVFPTPTQTLQRPPAANAAPPLAPARCNTNATQLLCSPPMSPTQPAASTLRPTLTPEPPATLRPTFTFAPTVTLRPLATPLPTNPPRPSDASDSSMGINSALPTAANAFSTLPPCTDFTGRRDPCKPVPPGSSGGQAASPTPDNPPPGQNSPDERPPISNSSPPASNANERPPEPTPPPTARPALNNG